MNVVIFCRIEEEREFRSKELKNNGNFVRKNVPSAMVDRLPRDIQLEIIKRAGMDARIVVGRLRVPQRVADAITAIRRPILFGCLCRVDLGVYSLQYIESHMDPFRRAPVVPERWHTFAYKRSGYRMLEIQSIDVSYDRTTWMTDE